MKISDKIKSLLNKANAAAFPGEDQFNCWGNFLTLSLYLTDDGFQVGFEKWDGRVFDESVETPGAKYKGMLFDYVESESLVAALNRLEEEVASYKPEVVPETIEQNGYRYELVGPIDG